MSITAVNSTAATTEPKSSDTQNHLRPRRTINRLALAVAGVVLAALGQIFLNRGMLWDGLLFLAMGAILFSRALLNILSPNYIFTLTNPQLADTLTTRSGWRGLLGLWLMVLAAAASIFNYNLFDQPDARTQAWWLYAGSIVVFVGGGLLLTPGLSLRAELRRWVPNRYVAFGLLAVLVLALFSNPLASGLMKPRPDYKPVK